MAVVGTMPGLPDTPVRVVVAVSAGTERSSSPQRGGLPVVLVVAGNTLHCTGHDKETPELPEAVHLDVRHAVVLLPVDLHWLRTLPSLLLQQPLQLPELPVPRPLRPGDSAPLLRTGAPPPQLGESLLHEAPRSGGSSLLPGHTNRPPHPQVFPAIFLSQKDRRDS